MNRRNFLQAMLAAAAAPAICRAENLMKIYVPPQKTQMDTVTVRHGVPKPSAP